MSQKVVKFINIPYELISNFQRSKITLKKIVPVLVTHEQLKRQLKYKPIGLILVKKNLKALMDYLGIR